MFSIVLTTSPVRYTLDISELCVRGMTMVESSFSWSSCFVNLAASKDAATTFLPFSFVTLTVAI
ncbi:hypothetical protein D3C86_2108970 [compost metagenome]